LWDYIAHVNMHFLIFFCSNPATFIEELDLHTVNLDSHITYHTINTLHRTCPDTYNKGTVWHVWHKPLPWNMLWHIIERYNIWHVWPKPLPWNMLWHIIEKYSMTCLTQTLAMKYSQTCLSDHLYITTSFVSRPYLFLPSVFPCIRPLYSDPLSNVTNDRVLWVKILHITTIRRLLSNRKLDNK
jgi:hypothetical protein